MIAERLADEMARAATFPAYPPAPYGEVAQFLRGLAQGSLTAEQKAEITDRLKITPNTRETAILALAKSVPSWWIDAITSMAIELAVTGRTNWVHPDDRPKPKKAKKAK